MIKVLRKFFYTFSLLLSFQTSVFSQTFPFSSGPIPMCDTSYFTCNVSGASGVLEPPGTGWGVSINSICIDITSNHPSTLQITLTSPAGTTLLLSQWLGLGGTNYTNTCFTYASSPSITTGTAPFTGNWTAMGGSLSVFDTENPNGIWIITVIDTLCSGIIPPGGGGGPPVDGWFNGGGGGGGSGGITISPNIPPCNGGISSYTVSVCSGQPVDILSYYTGNPFYNYAVYTSGWGLVPNPNAVTIPGSYNIEGWDWLTGCLYYGTFTINAASQANLGPDQVINATCSPNPMDLTSLFNTTGFTSSWTLNGSPIATATAAAATTSGIYQLIASSSAGCNDTVIVDLTISIGIGLGPDQNILDCNASSFDLTGLYNTTGSTTVWYFNLNPVANPSMVSANGTYTIIATMPSGCADTALVNLSIYIGPSLGPDQNITGCTSGAFNLTNLYNTTGFSSTWYLNGNPVGNPTAVVVNGIYTLVCSNGNGCVDTAKVTLNLSVGPNLGPNQTVNICAGGSVDLTTLYVTGANTPAWTFGGVPVPNPSSVNTAGIYTLIVTSANGCKDTAEVTLNVTPVPSIGPDQLHDICSNTTIDLTSLYNTTGYTTSWLLNGASVSNPAAANSSGTYVLIVSSSGCADTAMVVVNHLLTPALGPDQSAAICSGNSVDLTALFNTTGFTNSWTLTGVPVIDPTSISVAGTYVLIANATSGCSDTAQVIVGVGALPVLGANQQITECNGAVINLTTLYNTSGYSITWTQNGGAPVSNPAAVTNAGVYTLTVTNAAGCTASSVVTVTLHPKPDLGAEQSITLCNGEITDLTALFALNGLTTIWTESGIVFGNPTSVSTSGIYQLIASNGFGCSDTAYTTVSVTPGPSLGPDQSFDLCPWMTVDLSSVYNLTGLTATYTLNGLAVTNYIAVYDSGIYIIDVEDANGCTDQAVVMVNNIECLCKVDFSFTGNCFQEPVAFQTISDSVILGAHWSFSNPSIPDHFEINPNVKFRSSESVFVTLEAQLSCGTVFAGKYVQLNDCSDSCDFFLPSAFTPNNDGINDKFSWHGECVPVEYSMEIYNRFGQVVFKSENAMLTWDGKYLGQPVPAGVYVYRVQYRLPFQPKQVINAIISVLR